MSKLLRIDNKLMLNTNNMLVSAIEYVPPPVTRVVYNTSSAQADTYTSKPARIVFAVLPTIADTTQFAIVNNGISTEAGCAIFWVTYYTIDAFGNLSVTGYKASNNSTSCSNSTSWPTYPSNYLYYRGDVSVYGVSREIHKMGLAVPADAIAVLVAYVGGNTSETIYTTTVETDKVYSSVQDSCCALIQGSTLSNAVFNIAANTETTLNYNSSDIVYPYASNRTLVVGSRTSLGF